MISNMPETREWDVSVRGRIEHVTDQDEFPDKFQAELALSDEISIVKFNYPTASHSTWAVVRISASGKESAEGRARDIVLRAYWRVARTMTSADAFGWTLSAEAVPAQ